MDCCGISARAARAPGAGAGAGAGAAPHDDPVPFGTAIGNIVAGAAAGIGAAATAVEKGQAPRPSFTNPVYGHDAADPSVIRGADGAYYAFTTNTGYADKSINTPVVRSTDLVHWKFVGDAFPGKPAWVDKDLWAPHIAKTGDHFTLIYSGRQGNGNMAVGYATSAAVTGPFQDRGILYQSSSGGHEIDPYLLQDGGKSYLYWGSGTADPASGGGIWAQEVTFGADGSAQLTGDKREVLHPSGDAGKYDDLEEGAWVTRHDGYYYLFSSGGKWDSHYAVNVARSRSPLGPFEKAPAPILAGNQAFHNPGHNSIVTDASGTDWIVYHAFVPGKEAAGRELLIDRIDWKGGWPEINGGRGPTSTSQAAPVADARAAVRPPSSGNGPMRYM